MDKFISLFTFSHFACSDKKKTEMASEDVSVEKATEDDMNGIEPGELPAVNESELVK